MALKPKPCNRECGATIQMDNKDGRWLPYNMDGTVHKCNAPKTIEDKDDHGNESYSPTLPAQQDPFQKMVQDSLGTSKNNFVDHTVARPSKVKIFHSENSDLVEIAYNEFLQSKTFQWTRAQLGSKGDEFAIALYYEEVTA